MVCMKVGFAALVLAGLLCGCATGEYAGKQSEQGPEGVNKVADSKPKLTVDFSKRYDVHFSEGEYSAARIVELKACRFLGYVSAPETASQGQAGQRYHGYSSFSKKGGEPFVPDLAFLGVDYLVLERPDGRRVYIRQGALISFAESGP
jgi:hypothetical protein